MSHDSEQWSLLQQLFHLAEESPPEAREQVLTAGCGDPAMVRRVLDLVNGSEALDRAPSRSATAAFPMRIGSYTLLRLIGSGGIGSVYLAERIAGGAPQRSALKMLSPHAAGPSFVERFHREEHILGSLNHANITRLLDAGLSGTGHPYLVMEYVEGEHFDAYCDAHNLNVAARLRLFLSVCDAVAYAHRNLIVHLDLKPSNILVTTEGTVKLLDFGTSKLIQTDSQLTTTVLATPSYASPEQLRNEPVTTLCDVYSLGAILFELLSGRRPYAGSSVAFMLERALAELSPESPTQGVNAEAADHRATSENRLRQSLRGDLETIVGKCLRPRPQDRYASVDLLAQDIERYLSGRPVLARPQTAFYRMSKFVRRNRKLVVLGAVSAALLVAVLGYAEVKQRRAIEEGRRAVQMQNFLYSLLHLANSGFMGKPNPTVSDFLHVGARVLPQYIQDPADLRAAQLSLARSMAENDDLDDSQMLYAQAERSAKASGDVNAEADAEAHLGELAYIQGDSQKGAALTAHALELSRDRRVSSLVRADSEMYYAFYRDNLGFQTDENLRLLRDAVEVEKRNHQPPNEMGFAVRLLADDYLNRGQASQAEPWLQDAQQIYGNDPALLCGRAAVEGDLSYVMGTLGNLSKAIEQGQQAYQDMSRCSGDASHQTAYEATYLADLLLKAGRNQEALELMRKTVPLERKVAAGSTDFSDSLRILAKALLKTGHLPEAERTVKEAIAIRTGKTSPNHPVFGALYLLDAEILVAEHRDRDALSPAEAADRIFSAAGANSPVLRYYATESARVLGSLRARLGLNKAKHNL